MYNVYTHVYTCHGDHCFVLTRLPGNAGPHQQSTQVAEQNVEKLDHSLWISFLGSKVKG